MKLNVAYNKTTKQLVGYSQPKRGEAIVVTAYAIDDLEKKFQKIIATRKLIKDNRKNRDKVMEMLRGQDKREIDLIVQSSKGNII